jgi:hypothetical protein
MTIKINPPPLNPNTPDFNRRLVEVIRLMWVKLMGADGSSDGLPVTDGGTGADNAADARNNLGLEIGVDVQAYDAALDAISGVTPTNNVILVGNGSEFVGTALEVADFQVSGGVMRISPSVTINTTGNVTCADLTSTGNTTLGDTSADTLTINAGTWTIGSNYVATRAVGTAATGNVVPVQNNMTFTGDAGGGTLLRAWRYDVASLGANAVAEIRGATFTATSFSSNTTTLAIGAAYACGVNDTGNITTARALQAAVNVVNTGNVTTGSAYSALAPTLSSTGAITTLTGFNSGNLGHASLVTNAIGFNAENMTVSPTLTVSYRSQQNSGTGAWGFLHTGTANNAFKGATRFGSTTAPINTVDITGSFGRGAPVTKTGDFTLAATESWVINNKSGSACTVTLPAASSWTGREVMFQNYQGQQLNSASSNVVPLGGGVAGTAILSANAGRWATCVSDGTNWVIMQGVI